MKRRFLQSDFWRAAFPLTVLVVILAAWHLGMLPASTEHFVRSIGNDGHNAQGLVLLTRNYYEELTDIDRGLWQGGPGYKLALQLIRGDKALRDKEDTGNWARIRSSGIVRETGGFVEYELLENLDVTFMSARLQTNRWGQRDRDYELQKPPGTFRIAVVGASNSMGYGVELDEIFCEIVERRLNDELAGKGFRSYEVINFSVGGYEMLDRMHVLAEKVPAFQPDLVLMELTMHDLRYAMQGSVVGVLARGFDLGFEHVQSVVSRAGVRAGDSEFVMARKLRPLREPLATACFLDLKQFEERTGIPVAIMHLRLRVDEMHDSLQRQAELSERAGLLTLRVFDAYEGRSGKEVYLTNLDYHPSVLGHQLIAEELYEKMLEQPKIRILFGLERAIPEKKDP